MKKTIALLLVSISIIILLAFRGSHDSISVNHNGEKSLFDPRSVAMGCGPSPQAADRSLNSNGNFQTSVFLSDEEVSKFKYESQIWELGPGQTDTISHRHDCDVFVTVLEGTLLIGQEFKPSDTVRTGEIFHEHRNVIHSVSINPSKDQRMKAFVVYIRKDGRAGYTPLYPKKQ